MATIESLSADVVLYTAEFLPRDLSAFAAALAPLGYTSRDFQGLFVRALKELRADCPLPLLPGEDIVSGPNVMQTYEHFMRLDENWTRHEPIAVGPAQLYSPGRHLKTLFIIPGADLLVVFVDGAGLEPPEIRGWHIGTDEITTKISFSLDTRLSYTHAYHLNDLECVFVVTMDDSQNGHHLRVLSIRYGRESPDIRTLFIHPGGGGLAAINLKYCAFIPNGEVLSILELDSGTITTMPLPTGLREKSLAGLYCAQHGDHTNFYLLRYTSTEILMYEYRDPVSNPPATLPVPQTVQGPWMVLNGTPIDRIISMAASIAQPWNREKSTFSIATYARSGLGNLGMTYSFWELDASESPAKLNPLGSYMDTDTISVVAMSASGTTILISTRSRRSSSLRLILQTPKDGTGSRGAHQIDLNGIKTEEIIQLAVDDALGLVVFNTKDNGGDGTTVHVLRYA
ncbi:hypothetical protein C8J56DRAFT_1074034 [Mycena floridula]|nr:hypothetical protein C8J56DRAFT_1074034 [Mycena floridula]